MANLSSTKTLDFLESIKPLIVHGPVNSDNLYSWSRFPYNGTMYFITPDMQYAIRISKCEGKELYFVAPHNGNKDGRRPRYTFHLGGDNFTISTARLNAALLIPGCIDELIKNPALEINHKAYSVTPELKTVYNMCYSLYSNGIAYEASLISAGTEANKARVITLGRIKMLNSDIYDAFVTLTDNMTHKPFQPIDNRAYNLELCTKEENQAHYRMVTEFTRLQGSGIVKNAIVNDATMRRIPAYLALNYVSNRASRFSVAATILASNPAISLSDVVSSMHDDKIIASALSVLLSDEYRETL